ncbi:hypothetical protein NDU88_004040 [Pleurodeles waltl]|uniref:Galectin n=1 Tax=Pleurodeles waltl TaxID=8319 RepID=A0AAV7L7H1_PLEWA|nr:hypothetical protein NDU88_004040 [Pleurodeles waltl]
MIRGSGLCYDRFAGFRKMFFHPVSHQFRSIKEVSFLHMNYSEPGWEQQGKFKAHSVKLLHGCLEGGSFVLDCQRVIWNNGILSIVHEDQCMFSHTFEEHITVFVA